MRQVLKFGGSSVSDAANMRKTMEVVRERMHRGRAVVVVSAMGGVTDALIQCGEKAAEGSGAYLDGLVSVEERHLNAVTELVPPQKRSATLSLVKRLCNELEDAFKGVHLLGELSARTRDRILCYGELLSSSILSAAFNAHGMEAEWVDARQVIRTDSAHGRANVDTEATEKAMRRRFKGTKTALTVMPGFIASDAQSASTTLGRGGSDFTAAIVAASLECPVLEIWTDVSGMMTADPREVPGAQVIPSISYEEAMELSHFGAKVVYPPTLQPAMSKGIPVWIKNTFAPADGGTVIGEAGNGRSETVRGISSVSRIALISLEGSGMVGVPGFSKRLFEALADAGINVVLITQASSEHSICVGIEAAQADRARERLDAAFAYEIATRRVEPVKVEKDLAIVALVGDRMKSHPGISGRMFGVLGRNGINVRAIAQGSSERNITAVVSTADVRKALNVLHEEFFQPALRQINLFVAGTGNVGGRLLQQLAGQRHWMSEQLGMQIRVVGLCNSRRMVVDGKGVSPENWQERLQSGEKADIQSFSDEMVRRNLRNSVFVDVTASEEPPTVYAKLLRRSMSVVACNKVAASSEYANYRMLKDLAREYNCRFLFETNVGAGLPVIGTLNDLIGSGDSVHRIEAVLSGTLNFVFNHYDGRRPFADVVRQAQEEGYTEPDPRLDLGGTDVMRKIMILAREAGEPLEMEDVLCRPFLPASCMEGSVEDFYREMGRHEDHFRKLYDEASAKGCKLKFVASYDKGRAEVGLQSIPPGHDFHNLYGKDNIVLFYTKRYPEQPLVVKGAGAGAEVTASGVFADIMRARLA